MTPSEIDLVQPARGRQAAALRSAQRVAA